jgi:hypothetical protein
LIRRAFDGGINYFFFYGPGSDEFIAELAALAPQRRGGTQRRSLMDGPGGQ